MCVCESRALLYVAVVCIVRADGYAHGRTLYSFLPARLPLCSVCVEGYFEQFGRCAQCPPSAGASVVTMIGIGLLLLFVCFFVYFIRTILPVDILKLGLSMLQVTLATSRRYALLFGAVHDKSREWQPCRLQRWQIWLFLCCWW